MIWTFALRLFSEDTEETDSMDIVEEDAEDPDEPDEVEEYFKIVSRRISKKLQKPENKTRQSPEQVVYLFY